MIILILYLFSTNNVFTKKPFYIKTIFIIYTKKLNLIQIYFIIKTYHYNYVTNNVP